MGKVFYMFDGATFDDSFTSLEEARGAAEKALSDYRNDANSGAFWPEETRRISWGEAMGGTKVIPLDEDGTRLEDDGLEHDVIDFDLVAYAGGQLDRVSGG